MSQDGPERPEDQAGPSATPNGKSSTAKSILSTLAWLGFAVAAVLLVQTFIARPFVIPSESMLPALKPGDRILVGKLRMLWGLPERGQVVVFRPPHGASQAMPRCGDSGGMGTKKICTQAWGGQDDSTFFVKRIIALAGDRVSMNAGRIILNGKALAEPYVQSLCPDSDRCDFPQTVQVPQGQVLVLGDNRGDSDDGRFWGTIPTGWITGRMIALWWPLDRFSLGQPGG